MKILVGISILVSLLTLAGCAAPTHYDYTAFRESKPKSILVLPPQNHSSEVKATAGFYAQVTHPLAESGYYVFPVAVVNETFHQNGFDMASDIHQIPLDKLHAIFGADSVMYIDIKEYGTTYLLLSSDTRVTASAKLVDLRTGKLLWEGSATASSQEQDNGTAANAGLAGMLVGALIDQVVDTIADKGYDIAGTTSVRLLSSGATNGILAGPRAKTVSQ